MADTKISGLTAATSVDGTEVVPIVQTTTKKSTLAIIRDWMQGAFTSLTANQVTNNTSLITGTGYYVDGANTTPMVDLSGTWNTTGIATGIKATVTHTAAAAASVIMDLRTGGGSIFSVGASNIGGAWYDRATINLSQYSYVIRPSGAFTLFGTSYTAAKIGIYESQIRIASGAYFTWCSDSANVALGSDDLFIRRRAAASLALGDADAAAPVAQTLGVQSVVAGTSDTAGAA